MQRRRNQTLMLLAFLLGGGALGACGPSAPANPTWDADVRPLLEARCLRCHSNPSNMDPFTTTDKPGHHFDYLHWGDIQAILNVTPTESNAVWAKAVLPSLYLYAKGPMGTTRRMPPPPGAALEDWQIETLERWGANPQ
jgi:hypothetical protein